MGDVAPIMLEQQGPKSVFISTYGCQMNVNDTERMYSLLEAANYNSVPSPQMADLIIINSCSVREKPVHKVFSEVGTYRKMKEKNPHLKIGVGGCVGSQEKEKMIARQPMIDFVFGTDNIDQLPEIVARSQQGEKRVVQAQFRHKEGYDIQTLVRNPGVSSYVNIMKGCDNFCSFCVVPFTRGREKSRTHLQILEDVKSLVARGVKEITLLGQNVNSYESENNFDFADLIELLVTETKLERLRFVSAHPKDFDEKLALVLGLHQDKCGEYIHLPFQSGNTRVLEMMNRGYTRENYLERMQMIRKHVPQAAFSTDIIVGFPGETEEEFQDTLSLIEEIGFETIYAFKYSPRPFTKAAKFEGQLSEEIKSERLERLFRTQEKVATKLAEKYQGQTISVLVENYDKERDNLSGRSSHNKLTYFKGSPNLVGQRVQVLVTEAFPAVLRGQLV